MCFAHAASCVLLCCQTRTQQHIQANTTFERTQLRTARSRSEIVHLAARAPPNPCPPSPATSQVWQRAKKRWRWSAWPDQPRDGDVRPCMLRKFRAVGEIRAKERLKKRVVVLREGPFSQNVASTIMSMEQNGEDVRALQHNEPLCRTPHRRSHLHSAVIMMTAECCFFLQLRQKKGQQQKGSTHAPAAVAAVPPSCSLAPLAKEIQPRDGRGVGSSECACSTGGSKVSTPHAWDKRGRERGPLLMRVCPAAPGTVTESLVVLVRGHVLRLPESKGKASWPGPMMVCHNG
jgi:hypothetical protein